MDNTPVDFAAVKTRQQAAWSSGDYAVIGTTLQGVGESLAEACDLCWDEPGLDVAALPADGAATLERDITDLLQRLNLAGGRSLLVPSEYLEVVLTRR